EQFDARFAKTPLERPGYEGLRRNAAIVLGNRGDQAAVTALIKAIDDDSAVVRGTIAWSLGQLGGEPAVAALKARLEVETEPGVLVELQQAIARST
ncbi:MAG TPA: HEAT repeat domain-containing protein, partial [Schlesneria sp.]